ncbi:hypothetical protein F5887DRAFT_1076136 [Amanita rubescens]|nr:hypothetical protein F5887DRAFT_1076136 [Amanita rubescens]
MQGYRQPSTDMQPPQKLYAGSVTNFASSYDTNSTGGMLKEDLVNRVIFDRDDVLKNVLRIFEVPQDTVNRLVTNLRTIHRSQFEILKKAISNSDEKGMYAPLVAMSSGKLWDDGKSLPCINRDFGVLDIPPSADLADIKKHEMFRHQLSSFIVTVKADLTEARPKKP